MVAQKDRPLAVLGNVGRLAQDLGDRIAILESHRHVHARHQRKVIGHVALIAVAEILAHVLRPLVRLGEEHAALVVRIDDRTHALQHGMRLGKVFVVRAFTHAQIGNRVQPQAVDAHVEPEAHQVDDGIDDGGIVVIQIRLMGKEAMPVILARDRVPRPVRRLGVREDDARARQLLVRIAPHVEVALGRAFRCTPRRLEPGMLIRGVIDDELGDDLESAAMRLRDEIPEIIERAVVGMHVRIVGDVVAVVAQRRRIERQQPDRLDAELLQVVELGDQAAEVADAVAVGVGERLDVQLVDDRIAVPVGVGLARGRDQRCGVGHSQQIKRWRPS